LFNNIFAPFFLGIKPGFEEIGEKKQFHDGKEYEELDQDNEPEPSSHGHVPEALVVKPEDPSKDIYRHLQAY